MIAAKKIEAKQLKKMHLTKMIAAKKKQPNSVG